jgi:hypothetical protein
MVMSTGAGLCYQCLHVCCIRRSAAGKAEALQQACCKIAVGSLLNDECELPDGWNALVYKACLQMLYGEFRP